MRRERLARLAAGRFDVLVIGGGITGAGVALDAAARGLRVALVEQADFAGGTSSRSTKLVHGGLRYLPMLDLGLVREDLEERGLLLRNAPHLVRPLPFVLPLYRGARNPLGLNLPAVLRAALPVGLAGGLWAYDILASLPRRISADDIPACGATARAPRRRMRFHRRLTPAAAAALVPPLRLDGLRRAYLYYDAVTDDARLTVTVIQTAVRLGAVACNYVRVTDLATDQERVTGARAIDALTGRAMTVSARTTVNATGVWAEAVAGLAGRPGFRIRPSKGVHLMLSPARLRLGRAALVLPETDDGRLAFVVPWLGAVMIGTTDTEWNGPPETPLVDRRDVDYLLDHASRFLTTRLRDRDVLGAIAGLRPLVSLGAGANTSSARISRRHEVVSGPAGFVSIVGGKLTAYRRMAEDVMNAVAGRPARTPSPTRRLPLDGADGLSGALPALRARARRLSLGRRTLVHLIRSYGTRTAALLDAVAARPDLGEPLAPGCPNIAAEVVVAVQEEMAATIGDVLLRRTRLAHLLPDAGVEVAPRVAALMAEELGWSPDEQRAAVEAYRRAAVALVVPDGTAQETGRPL